MQTIPSIDRSIHIDNIDYLLRMRTVCPIAEATNFIRKLFTFTEKRFIFELTVSSNTNQMYRFLK